MAPSSTRIRSSASSTRSSPCAGPSERSRASRRRASSWRPDGSLGAATLAALVAAAACGDDSPPLGAGGVGAAPAGGAGAGGAGASGAGVAQGAAGGGGAAPLPDTFSLAGRVVDQDGAPVAGAVVLQAGGAPQVVTGLDGTFTITITKAIPGVPAAAAGHVGYRSAAVELFELPIQPIELVLRIAKPPDNEFTYSYGDPGTGDVGHDNNTSFCGHCHTTFAAQFQTSAHARAARSQPLQDLYAGVAGAIGDAGACAAAGGVWRAGAVPGALGASQQRCYLGHGVLPDLNDCGPTKSCDDPTLPAAQAPQAFGACADCHAPGMDGPAGGRDLLEAEGVGYDDGVHCDACHHVREVQGLDAPGGTGGRLVMQRPLEAIDRFGGPLRQVMFGPFPDVANPFMGGSYQPQFATSVFCSGCHEHAQEALLPNATLDPAKWPDGRLPVHSTYSEWLAGPYNQPATQCRFCHMPEVPGMFNPVDVTDETNASIVFGYGRASADIRSHAFRGPLTETPALGRLIDGAAALSLDSGVNGATLDLSVHVTNVGCGHALPTGEPMRAVLLVVEVEGCGERFAASGGMTLPDLAGAEARGVIGAGVDILADQVAWPTLAGQVAPGSVLRVVRPSGAYWDYDGVGLFEGAQLSPAEKGVEIFTPVGSATVLSESAGTLTLDAAIAPAAGDLVFLGEASPLAFVDGDPVRALAGAPGALFARVLADPNGARQVPHWRAVDVVSDNRIRPLEEAVTQHQFTIPPGCSAANVHLTALYRPEPLGLARERGWDGRDWVSASETVSLSL